MAHSGVNPVGGKQVFFQKCLQQDAAHLAGAQDCHADKGQLRRNFRCLDGDLGHFLFSFVFNVVGAPGGAKPTPKDTRTGAESGWIRLPAYVAPKTERRIQGKPVCADPGAPAT